MIIMIIKDQPAFPCPSGHIPQDKYDYNNYHAGITIRQYYAAKAMQGLLAGFRDPVNKDGERDFTQNNIAELAFAMADAMIEYENNENNSEEKSK